MKRFGFREYIESGKGVAEILVGREEAGAAFRRKRKERFRASTRASVMAEVEKLRGAQCPFVNLREKETTSDGPVENAKGQMG